MEVSENLKLVTITCECFTAEEPNKDINTGSTLAIKKKIIYILKYDQNTLSQHI